MLLVVHSEEVTTEVCPCPDGVRDHRMDGCVDRWQESSDLLTGGALQGSAVRLLRSGDPSKVPADVNTVVCDSDTADGSIEVRVEGGVQGPRVHGEPGHPPVRLAVDVGEGTGCIELRSVDLQVEDTGIGLGGKRQHFAGHCTDRCEPSPGECAVTAADQGEVTTEVCGGPGESDGAN